MGPIGADRMMPIDRQLIISVRNVAKTIILLYSNRKITKKIASDAMKSFFFGFKVLFSVLLLVISIILS